ncbi:pyridoxal phosphate-dependent aminotransferase [Bifidobacterium canis]|uniref:Aminotransferase n=1 Tax=Bifidobacterium canis TaxID=2610880 RepID=A0A7K1J264_9BIFI|nr:aminotransferase class I/II-fold pyridoxal phosphate-dependent enzyme [Bifidobacterium canis]MUH58727.1 aminotransferase [Bifidobacterium canis]
MTISFSKAAQSIPPNVFERMDRKVLAARQRGIDVIDLSKGNPDGFPEDFIRSVTRKAVDEPANARYTPFDGKPEFLQAAANWYRNVHGVTLDPQCELFAVEGAVDGLADLFSILLDPGDAVAFADPYYPSYHCMANICGAREVLLPAREDLGWLPDLDAVAPQTWQDVKLLVLNYPNNPTGAQAPLSFFEHAVELAVEHNFVIVHDFAYAGLGVNEQQHSLLEVIEDLPEHHPARDLCVEVCSLSKMYAMAGWRAGFIAGSEQVLDVAKEFHYQMGSMITSFVQDAGVAALNSDQSCVARQAAHYATRRAIVANGLRELGHDLFDSQGGLYVWMRAPQGKSGEQFADELLDKAAVAVLPGTCFGHTGEHYVRLSLLQPDDRLAEAVRRIGACC